MNKLSGCDSVRLGLVKSTKDELNSLYLNKYEIGFFQESKTLLLGCKEIFWSYLFEATWVK